MISLNAIREEVRHLCTVGLVSALARAVNPDLKTDEVRSLFVDKSRSVASSLAKCK